MTKHVQALEGYFPCEKEFFFSLGLLERLLLSSLIEGDRRDTAEFMASAKFHPWPEDMTPTWNKCLKKLEAKLSALPKDTEINEARYTISEECRAFAENEGGIYSLNVPTGGGKTLSSLRYALAHAAKFNKKRIIFTSPLLSILEQNAKVIRDYISDDSLILEHHSNVVNDETNGKELDERELQIQTWDSPIIITTMVQLLNTFFDGRTSAVRRFHSLCNSIIVIDEVQTVPVKMLTLFNLTIQYLSRFCNTTVILCSATQPSLDQSSHPLKAAPQDIVPFDNERWSVFKRTDISVCGNMKFEDAPSFIKGIMEESDSLLVVCNTKSEAAKLTRSLDAAGWNIFHLSASMCVQHRRDTIKALKQSLDGGKRTLCISTQVIEAGVDISFQKVIRFMAGLDSVIQAAGRCNRNGEYDEPQTVYVVNITDEKLGRLPEIQRGKTAMIALGAAYANAPEAFDNDMASWAAIKYYYRRYYQSMDDNEQDLYLKEVGATMFDLLSKNEKFADARIPNINDYQLYQAFNTAGQLFTVFENDLFDVIVPYKEGKGIIEELSSEKAIDDFNYRDTLLKRARPYTVSIYQNQRHKLEESGVIYPICKGFATALSPGNYDEIMGLMSDSKGSYFLEV